MALQHECSPTNVGLVAAKLADPIVLVNIGPVVDLVVEATTRKATMVATMTKITATAIAINFTFGLVTFTLSIFVF